MGLWHKVKFQFVKLMRMCWFSLRYSLYKWKKIEGTFIPVSIHYGYSVLRFIDNGQYEQGEITIIKNTLEPRDVVLELGSGIGFVSSYCARLIGSENVHTYEANASLKNVIETSYRKNKVRPEVTFAMLGDKPGTKMFYRDAGWFLASSTEIITGKKQTGAQVPVLDLNAVIQEIRPTYLMMDIEGGEHDIFNIIDFQSIKKIQFELHPAVLDAEKVKAVFSLLAYNNFFENTTYTYDNNFYFQKKQMHVPNA